ncbi:MAG: ferredoxin--NADP reductase, partial [Rhodobacteraceae bacterium]|nr:ferredoxin--NADP reductase [Paracoccaceae bacterium]
MTEQKTISTAGAHPAPKTPALPDAQTVTQVRHYTDRLFAFRVTRPASLRFRSGEFVMIGLMGDTGKPLLRAYSIASPAWDEELEFYSIKVPDGPLTSKLQHIKEGEEIILR